MDLQLSSNAATVAGGLRAAAAELPQLEPVNRRAGELVAAAPAPHRLGGLAASVRADATATDVTVAGHTPYWTFVHWGAPKIHLVARPWLLAATQARQSDLVELYTDHAAAAVALVGD